MWRNFLKATVRNLAKQKLLSLINILGLSIGLACSMLFILYTIHELSYDRFHQSSDRIYQVYRNSLHSDDPGRRNDTYLPMPLGPAIKAEFVDVEEAVRMRSAWDEEFVRVRGQVGKLPVAFADPEFFEVFTFPILYGNRANALSDLHQIVLTKSSSQRLFGQENSVGMEIEIKVNDAYQSFTVSAILEEFSPQSSIQLEALCNYHLLSETALGERYQNHWNRSSFQTFVKLAEGSNLASDQDRLDGFRQKYYPGEEDEMRTMGLWDKEGLPVTYGLMPITKLHTQPDFQNGFTSPVNPITVWLLLAIAFGVLLVACINFTTLAIGRSSGRAKEVGIRKIIGSMRKDLMIQFIGEAILLSTISAILAVSLLYYIVPSFNQLANANISLDFEQAYKFWPAVAMVTLFCGLLAGAYPSFVLSGFKPLNILQSRFKISGSNAFTKSLVVFQFVISTGLICATVIILKQLNHLNSLHPGFDKENVIVVDAHGTDTGIIGPRFKTKVNNVPGILGVAGSEQSLGANAGWSRTGWDYRGEIKETFEYYVDEDYLDVLGMQLLDGRNFNPAIAEDSSLSVIVNEAFLRDFNWPLDSAVGKELIGYFPEGEQPRVIGVVKDFHYLSFKEEVLPQIFHHFADYAPYQFFIRLPQGNPESYLASIENAWQEVADEIPFNFAFLDENLQRFYESEERWSKIIAWAGSISIFLACLGLFGLAVLASSNRRKELGIRKVLGASVSGLSVLLARDFLKLIVIGTLIALPLTWYLMNDWLMHFAQRINISIWILLSGAILTAFLALLTVGFQSIRSALSNPIKSLRNE